MVVAPRPLAPTETDVFNAIAAAVGKLSQGSSSSSQRVSQIVSLSLPLPPVDLLAVFSDLQTDGHEFYCEQSAASEGLVASGCLAQWTGSGSDRFERAQQVAQTWFDHIYEIGADDFRILPTSEVSPLAPPAVRVLCRFTFEHSCRKIPQGLQVPAASLIIPRWQVTRRAEACQFTANLHLSSLNSKSIKAACSAIWQRYLRLQQSALPALGQWLRPSPPPTVPISSKRRRQFLDGVAAVLQGIERRQLTKAVLASALDLDICAPFPTVTALRLLRHSHSGCHVFAVRCGSRTFLGASPERLFHLRRQRLSTDAIAGSAPRGATVAIDQQLSAVLQRSSKELHEHRIVADFIVGRLRQLGLQPSWSSQPQLLTLANIQHLHTPITAQVPANIHPLQIVAKLHPTPAVAGFPQRAACEMIAQHEAFERSLYAGPIGWIDRQKNSTFVVAIRSALVGDERIRLYAGAGVVKGSVPEKEWQEVNMKLQAIAAVLSMP